jgi:hypothetical protein
LEPDHHPERMSQRRSCARAASRAWRLLSAFRRRAAAARRCRGSCRGPWCRLRARKRSRAGHRRPRLVAHAGEPHRAGATFGRDPDALIAHGELDRVSAVRERDGYLGAGPGMLGRVLDRFASAKVDGRFDRARRSPEALVADVNRQRGGLRQRAQRVLGRIELCRAGASLGADVPRLVAAAREASVVFRLVRGGCHSADQPAAIG